jgi:hypothetical protein
LVVTDTTDQNKPVDTTANTATMSNLDSDLPSPRYNTSCMSTLYGAFIDKNAALDTEQQVKKCLSIV